MSAASVHAGAQPSRAPHRKGADAWVEIPREPTWLYEFVGQRVRVPLPIKVHPRRAAILSLVGLFLAVGALCFSPLAYIGEVFDPRYAKPSLFEFALMGSITVLIAAFGALCTAVGAVAITDFLRRGPVLTLDDKGVSDRRIPIDVLWQDVASLVIVRHPKYGMVMNLLLKLRPGVPTPERTSCARIGVSQALWLARGRRVPVPVCLLEPSSHVATHAAAELVRRHGGRVLEFTDLLPDPPVWRRAKLRRPRNRHRS